MSGGSIIIGGGGGEPAETGIPTHGLISHYPFDADGTDLISGYNFSTQVGSPVFGGGKVVLNTSSYLATSSQNHAMRSDNRNNWILSLWVKNKNQQPFFSVGQYDKHGNAAYKLQNVSGTATLSAGQAHSFSMPYNTWTHLIVAMSNHRKHIYVDGELTVFANEVSTAQTQSISFEEIYLNVGYNGNANGEYGNMRIYDYAKVIASIGAIDDWVNRLFLEGNPDS